MTATVAMKLEDRYGSGLYCCGFAGESITGKKTSTRNAINASLGLDVVHRRAAARTAWCHADRQKRKLVDPVQDQKLGHARKHNGNRHGDDGGCGKATWVGSVGAQRYDYSHQNNAL